MTMKKFKLVLSVSPIQGIVVSCPGCSGLVHTIVFIVLISHLVLVVVRGEVVDVLDILGRDA